MDLSHEKKGKSQVEDKKRNSVGPTEIYEIGEAAPEAKLRAPMPAEMREIQECSPLEPDYYFDPKYWSFRRGLETDGYRYVGSSEELLAMLPERGRYAFLEQYDHSEMLIRTEHGLEMRSNICSHQHALLVDPKNRPRTDTPLGKLGCKGKDYVCPLHGFRFSAETGKLLKAPHFSEQPKGDLHSRKLQQWNGMWFDSPRDIGQEMRNLGKSQLFDPELLNLSNYVRVGEYPLLQNKFSLEVFMRVYCDLYHLIPCHQTTIASVVDGGRMNKSRADEYWEVGDRYSVQIAPWKESRRMTAAYQRQVELVHDLYGGKVPPHAAVWLAIYPGFIIEWYPHIVVVSDTRHTGIESCANKLWYYVRKEWAHRGQEIFEVSRPSFEEWLHEDDEIALSEHDGQRLLWLTGKKSKGVLHPDLEFGVAHYYQYIRRAASEAGVCLP